MKKVILLTSILIGLSAAQADEVNIFGIKFGHPTCEQFEKKISTSKSLQEKYQLEIADMEAEFDKHTIEMDLFERNLEVYEQMEISDDVYETMIEEYTKKLEDQDDQSHDLEDIYRDEEVRLRNFKILMKKFKRYCTVRNEQE